MSISTLITKTINGLKNNSPAILTGLAVVGTVATGYLASKAAFWVGREVEMKNRINLENDLPELTPKELIQFYWRPFIPTALAGAATIACVVGSQSINTQRQAAVFSAFTLSERAFNEYRDRNIDSQAGRNKDEKIRDAIVTEKVMDKDISGVVLLNENDCVCYDAHSDRTFISNMEDIRKAENDIGRQCINDDNASLNDFYSKIGLKRLANGDDLGWNNEYPLEIKYTSILHGSRPVLAIEFRIAPKLNYAKIWR